MYLERPRTFGAVAAWLLCALPALIALVVIVATAGDDDDGGRSKDALDIYDFQVTSSLVRALSCILGSCLADLCLQRRSFDALIDGWMD